ncbi:hypothetical protein CEUSTIGMA_g11195.t1 [Chlamydomonas eustigma]|uniref:Uncharacterized protein n=1 Tax=Chlamydomonas eustigma TaxID=1157962 RepID=A0A250XLW0_9CHLO|nr:hypothetical protein CEUSTIGMA_g11195.t1 [Chlamydomonas eustigma]|eukprot:GAX83770.1 hypothetical protein CEUSTIGMA_g11195.t1 [Chlamydomonas eustigma]
MSMFKKLFGSKEAAAPIQQPTVSAANKTINCIQNLDDQEQTLEKRKNLLEKKIDAELQRARELNKQGKKNQALLCLKKKKLMENELTNLDNMILRIVEQRQMLEGQRTTVEVMSAMHGAAQVGKANLKSMNIDNVDKVLDDIREANEQMEQIQQVLGAPTGMSADLDEDELLNELEEMEATDLDAELLEPAPVPTNRVPAAKLPAVPTQKAKTEAAKSPEELELEALQAEMAL